jgi:hypothetical protein
VDIPRPGAHITNKEIIQISKSKPNKISILCTFNFCIRCNILYLIQRDLCPGPRYQVSYPRLESRVPSSRYWNQIELFGLPQSLYSNKETDVEDFTNILWGFPRYDPLHGVWNLDNILMLFRTWVNTCYFHRLVDISWFRLVENNTCIPKMFSPK